MYVLENWIIVVENWTCVVPKSKTSIVQTLQPVWPKYKIFNTGKLDGFVRIQTFLDQKLELVITTFESLRIGKSEYNCRKMNVPCAEIRKFLVIRKLELVEQNPEVSISKVGFLYRNLDFKCSSPEYKTRDKSNLCLAEIYTDLAATFPQKLSVATGLRKQQPTWN